VAEVDPTAYANAAAQAALGISDTTHDLRTYQSTDPNEENIWYQFIVEQRSGYISAGEFLVNLLTATGDPRLEAYFGPNSSGQIVGAPPGGGNAEFSNLSDTRLTPDFRQPVVTYAENQLILAEGALQSGDAATALTAFNNERTSQGVPTASSVTLADIITEKYIALFQNIEVWNDYKRTCLPAIVPAQPGGIPARLLYPLSAERNANPNIPPPPAQPVRNPNDPNPCP
jgi:starch-binding outer membrane protein, SusD/RagB family